MGKPEISIIVPVYNTEKYLPGCIESILAQTISNFELLLIDDGSPDNCGKICDEYSMKDSRIRVFHKQNGGVGSARNLGLDNAQGDCIFFIDSDDTIEPDYLEKLKIVGDEDFVQGARAVLENDYLKQIMTHDEIFKDYNRFWMESRQQWCVLCCLSKKIINQYNLRYDQNLKMGEDGLFNQIYLSKCKKIRRTDYCGYNYNHDNELSASHRYYPDRLEQQIQLVKTLGQYFADEDIQRTRWDYWKEVLHHYRVKGVHSSDPVIRKQACNAIKETYRTECFRKCLPYIKSKGSLDEKLEAWCMGYYVHWMFKPILKLIQTIYKLKNIRICSVPRKKL